MPAKFSPIFEHLQDDKAILD
jgi:hypothetical protein